MESLVAFLPFLLLFLVCPLLMFFMMRGGHGHGAAHDQGATAPRPGTDARTPSDQARP